MSSISNAIPSPQGNSPVKKAFFETPQGKTYKKIMAVAAAFIMVAAVACVPPVAAAIPIGLAIVHLTGASVMGAAFLTAMIGTAILKGKYNRSRNFDFTSKFKEWNVNVNEVMKRLRTDFRGCKNEQGITIKSFIVNGKTLVDPGNTDSEEDPPLLSTLIKELEQAYASKGEAMPRLDVLKCMTGEIYVDILHSALPCVTTDAKEEVVLRPKLDIDPSGQLPYTYEFTIDKDSAKAMIRVRCGVIATKDLETIGTAILQTDVDLVTGKVRGSYTFLGSDGI